MNAIHNLAAEDSSVRAEKKSFNIVVAGEFNAGKSSVINTLLRRELLPARVNVSAYPPARIIPALNINYDIRIANSAHTLAKADLFSGAADAIIESITIATPLDAFNGANLFEVSVNQDGSLPADAQDVLSRADMLIWCTMGQRAWCLSEISIVETLPGHLLETAVLAVTRSDYLRNTEDIGKVESRLKREAGGFFGSILMMDCSRKTVSAVSNQAVWERSGGSALFDLVTTELKKSPFHGKARLAVVETDADREREPARDTVISLADLSKAWAEEVSGIEDWITAQAAPLDIQIGKYVHKRMKTFSRSLFSLERGGESDSGRAHRFECGATYIGTLLANPGQKNIAVLATDIALQLLREMRVPAEMGPAYN